MQADRVMIQNAADALDKLLNAQSIGNRAGHAPACQEGIHVASGRLGCSQTCIAARQARDSLQVWLVEHPVETEPVGTQETLL